MGRDGFFGVRELYLYQCQIHMSSFIYAFHDCFQEFLECQMLKTFITIDYAWMNKVSLDLPIVHKHFLLHNIIDLFIEPL